MGTPCFPVQKKKGKILSIRFRFSINLIFLNRRVNSRKNSIYYRSSFSLPEWIGRAPRVDWESAQSGLGERPEWIGRAPRVDWESAQSGLGERPKWIGRAPRVDWESAQSGLGEHPEWIGR